MLKFTVPSKDEMIACATAAAQRHGLRAALVCAIAHHESIWNPWAIRYEPAFFNKYVLPQYSASKFGVTEAKARAISWGLMQVMGEDAREFGFLGDLSSLCDPANALELGCLIFAHKLKVSSGDEVRALLAWNGGDNPQYPTDVLELVNLYEPPAPSGGKAISA